MSEKIKNLLVRTVSGIVLTVVIVGTILLMYPDVAHLAWPFATLLFAIFVGCTYEFMRLTAQGADLFKQILLFLAAVLYIALPLVLLFALPLLMVDRMPGLPHVAFHYEPAVLLMYFCIIWANDVFAYLTGITIGKHKMAPKISPKKSWEGFAGGLVGAVAVGLLFACLLHADSYLIFGGLALVAALGGVAGDLFESWLKRRAGVKDSGNLLPGHGGWLDRFDALLFSLPFSFIYLLLIQIL
jgi:phosphatidate cytidylyltransferase